eukprot:SAG31_NODE_2094_length_6458_cov_7.319547_2_plen_130_part_00
MIVMEHCAEGDLSDRINQEFGRPPWSDDGSDNNADTSDEDIEPLPPGPDRDEPVIPEGQVLRWLGQMADALSFVHSKNIIHRDIKSQNFFLTESGDIRLGASSTNALAHRALRVQRCCCDQTVVWPADQ